MRASARNAMAQGEWAHARSYLETCLAAGETADVLEDLGLVAWWLLPARLPATAAFAIILAATVTGCWLFYRAGGGVALLRPFIGLAPKPALGRRARLILRAHPG